MDDASAKQPDLEPSHAKTAKTPVPAPEPPRAQAAPPAAPSAPAPSSSESRLCSDSSARVPRLAAMLRLRLGVRVPAPDVQCLVRLLDGTELTCNTQREARGEVLLEQVNKHLDLLEKDCFGLRYRHTDGDKCWLDTNKPIGKQLKGPFPYSLSFRVKFYPPEPLRLKEALTRYLIYLQMKRDIWMERLQAKPSHLAFLAACILQAEIGDGDPGEVCEGRLTRLAILPPQPQPLESESHQIQNLQLRGFSPAEAEDRLLRRAQTLDRYGFYPYPCKDLSGATVALGFTPSGFEIAQDNQSLNIIPWAEIRKFKYEGKILWLSCCAQREKSSSLSFLLPCPPACKRLWRLAVEQHAFYSLNCSRDIRKVAGSTLLFRHTKFRFSGRVAKEVLLASEEIQRKPPEVHRCRMLQTLSCPAISRHVCDLYTSRRSFRKSVDTCLLSDLEEMQSSSAAASESKDLLSCTSSDKASQLSTPAEPCAPSLQVTLDSSSTEHTVTSSSPPSQHRLQTSCTLFGPPRPQDADCTEPETEEVGFDSDALSRAEAEELAMASWIPGAMWAWKIGTGGLLRLVAVIGAALVLGFAILLALLESGAEMSVLSELRASQEFADFQREFYCPLQRQLSGRLRFLLGHLNRSCDGL
uniref:FERM domain-containing protein 5-like n=1 Tax=Myxine glutinosa TaxID=7769 RepID=UPI00358DDDAE